MGVAHNQVYVRLGETWTSAWTGFTFNVYHEKTKKTHFKLGKFATHKTAYAI